MVSVTARRQPRFSFPLAFPCGSIGGPEDFNERDWPTLQLAGRWATWKQERKRRWTMSETGSRTRLASRFDTWSKSWGPAHSAIANATCRRAGGRWLWERRRGTTAFVVAVGPSFPSLSSSHRNPRRQKVNRTRPARCAPRRPPPSYPVDRGGAIPLAAPARILSCTG
ncbi:hypothetical protein BHE74_00026241 [Ensete ventricosum]|nr:hypothetical protein GW17_00042990 [Ensete ventricosum]RWW66396.1 hypothetical protein BHE74_00026241 [Ensete ventricosum]